jgi:hypothetical protein
MAMSSTCCIQGFEWRGTPTGKETTLAGNKTYLTGPEDSDAAIIIIHDLFGWTFPNLRLLADHYAREVNAAVYIPDLWVSSSSSYKLQVLIPSFRLLHPLYFTTSTVQG